MEAQEFDQWAGWPAPEPPPVKPQSETIMSHVRRYAAAGVLAVGLLASGVEAVAASSPDTSASPTTQSTSSANDNGGSSGGAASPSTDAQTGTHANCPKDQSSTSTDSTTPH